MKRTIAALLLLASIVGTAHAQVRKCLLPDGNVTYSDVLCTKNVAKQVDVNLIANSVDKSPARAEARKFAHDKLVAQARQREPNRCTFNIEPSIQGDGKQLAEGKRSASVVDPVQQPPLPARQTAPAVSDSRLELFSLTHLGGRMQVMTPNPTIPRRIDQFERL